MAKSTAPKPGDYICVIDWIYWKDERVVRGDVITVTAKDLKNPTLAAKVTGGQLGKAETLTVDSEKINEQPTKK